MKVFLVHNFYKNPGGEDRCFADELKLLKNNDNETITYIEHNKSLSAKSRLSMALSTVWNIHSYHKISKIVENFRPDIVHFHNTFPIISPAAYHAVKITNTPVVQTLHNYRLVCPAGTLLRKGKFCELCLPRKIAWPSVVHGCYRQSNGATAVIATMLSFHHMIGTWEKKVDAYIVLTEFSRNKFLEAGIPSKKIFVKPNFLHPDPEPGTRRDQFILFVGRLTLEKGIVTLLAAWRELERDVKLKIVGDGPLAETVAEVAHDNQLIEFLGKQSRARVLDMMGSANAVVVPSIWHEPFGLVVIEAFAKGRPVIASQVGGLADIVENGNTGLHFKPGDCTDLAEKVRWIIDHPSETERMGKKARIHYLNTYTASQNYNTLINIYHQVLQ